MEAQFPHDKIMKTKTVLSDLLRRKKVSLRETQSLISLLNFACSVVAPGRAFLRRSNDLTKGIKLPNHRVPITKSANADLRLWLMFIYAFNGRSFLLGDTRLSSDCLRLYNDAAAGFGFRALI